jgi:hypothetical protein
MKLKSLKVKNTVTNEYGAVLVVALIMLVIITAIGIAATRTSETELQIASNGVLYETAFYAAEAGIAYVAENHKLYGPDNITVGLSKYFPNDSDHSERYPLSSTQSFNGNVEHIGFSVPPRGSGYDAEKFKAYKYQMISNGLGPLNAQSQIDLGFYRIGF